MRKEVSITLIHPSITRVGAFDRPLTSKLEFHSRKMDLLWHKDNSGSYVDIFKNVSTEASDSFIIRLNETESKLKALKINDKNDKISVMCREQGNEQFRSDQWLEAMNSYNSSLCYAEIGSETVGLAYANRSACFFQLKMYDECLVDIELARQANYPARLIPKLDQRREDCLKLVAAVSRKDKLSYESDENFPGMANILEIRCDKTFGRHIVAKCDIPVGKIVLAEKSFMTRILNKPYISCAVCMKSLMNFVACTQCTSTLFCQSGCADVNDIHKIDCGEVPDTGCGPLRYYLDAIIFIIGMFTDIDQLIEFVENVINSERITAPHSLDDVKSKFRALLQLSKNDRPIEMKSEERFKESLLIYNNILLRKSIRKMFETEQKSRFLMHLVLHLNCVAINNGFTATMPDDGQKMSMYIIASYFNHSCAPNVLGMNTDQNVRYCRTVRPIKAGQQLFISYLNDCSAQPDHNFMEQMDSADRRKMLYENFNFRCKCERCVPNMKFWLMNARAMRSDHLFQWLNKGFGAFLNDNVGEKAKKIAMVEMKIVDLLNRFGDKHWCDELGGMIATYETFF